MARSALMNVMVNAVLKAGKAIIRDFGELQNLQVSRKGPGGFVSASDRRAGTFLVAELQKARPGYGTLSEESGAVAGSDTTHRWIVDPLGGTMNFLHGIPIFAISIALEREGTIAAGVIYNPILNELYLAERGGGAFLNDRRLRIGGRGDLADCVIGTGTPHPGRTGQPGYLAELAEIMARAGGVRRSGSPAMELAWVASGRYDGYWQHGAMPWEVAAGLILVREAGGFVTDATGGSDIFGSGSLLAGNQPIRQKLQTLFSKAGAEA